MVPWLTPALCAGLRAAFGRVGFDVDGVPALLGPAAHDRPVDELAGHSLPAVRELVRHGLLAPEQP